jgi:hypothetical protein
MKRPGERIHRLAARALDKATVARLVAPAVADLQFEVERARRDGQTRQRRRAMIRGYASLLRLLPFLLVLSGRRYAVRFLRDESDALLRVLVATAAAAAVLTGLLILPAYPGVPQMGQAFRLRVLVLLTPQALGVALPTGFLVGTLIGLRGRARHARTLRRLFACATALALVTFGIIEWGVPGANHRFRDLVVRTLAADGIGPGAVHLEDGPGEMSLSELSRHIDAAARDGAAGRDLRALRLAFHLRIALLCSPLALAVMGFGMAAWGQGRWWTVVTGIGLLAVVIVLVWFDGPADAWPPVLRAWAPDALFAAVGLALLRMRTDAPGAAAESPGRGAT